MRESLKPSFLITFRVSSFVTSSFQRVRKGLVSGTLPETFPQLCYPFLTLSQRRGASLCSYVTPRGSRTLEHVEERDGKLMSPLVSGQALSTPGCSSRPSRKSSSRTAGCPVAVCWLWSWEMGEVQLFPCLLCAGHNIPASPPSSQTRRLRCSCAEVWQRASQLQADRARF